MTKGNISLRKTLLQKMQEKFLVQNKNVSSPPLLNQLYKIRFE